MWMFLFCFFQNATEICCFQQTATFIWVAGCRWSQSYGCHKAALRHRYPQQLSQTIQQRDFKLMLFFCYDDSVMIH